MDKEGKKFVVLGLIATIIVGILGILDVIFGCISLPTYINYGEITLLILVIVEIAIGAFHIGLAIFSTVKLIKNKDGKEGFSVVLFDVGIYFVLAYIVNIVTYSISGFSEEQLVAFITSVVCFAITLNILGGSKIYKKPATFKRRRIMILIDAIVFLIIQVAAFVINFVMHTGLFNSVYNIIISIVNIALVAMVVATIAMFKPTKTEKDPFTGETITTTLGEESNHMLGISSSNSEIDRRASRDDLMARRFGKHDE